ncbi:MAG: hypothetical protein AVDCRST_MAG03-2911, partial [uncultured Rubrobacteraceae bacterium]
DEGGPFRYVDVPVVFEGQALPQREGGPGQGDQRRARRAPRAGRDEKDGPDGGAGRQDRPRVDRRLRPAHRPGAGRPAVV